MMKTIRILLMKTFGILLIIAASIIVAVFICFITVDNVKNSMRNSMKEYLQNTYKREFEVDIPKFGFDTRVGFHIFANSITRDNGIDIVNRIEWYDSLKEFPFESDIITADIWSKRAIPDFNKLVSEVYGGNAILEETNSFELDIYNKEKEYNRYKNYFDKDYKYIVGLAKKGKERIYISINYVVIIDGKINVEEETKKIKKLRENVKTEFKPENLHFGITFITKKYELKTYKLKDIELSEEITSEYSREGSALIKEGKLIGNISVYHKKSEILDMFTDEEIIKDEFKRILT